MARQRAQAGSPLRISAGDYNDAVDAGQWFAQQQALGRGGSGASGAVNPCTVIVRNDSGGALPVGSVVQLDDPPISTLDRKHMWFTAKTPTTTTGCYGVLLQPIPSGKYGEAQVSGTCLAIVDVDSTTHTHVAVTASQTKFQSGSEGWARLVHASSMGDNQLVPVLIRGSGASIPFVYLSDPGIILTSGSGSPSAMRVSSARWGAVYFKKAFNAPSAAGITVLTSSAATAADPTLRFSQAGFYRVSIRWTGHDVTSYTATDWRYKMTIGSNDYAAIDQFHSALPASWVNFNTATGDGWPTTLTKVVGAPEPFGGFANHSGGDPPATSLTAVSWGDDVRQGSGFFYRNFDSGNELRFTMVYGKGSGMSTTQVQFELDSYDVEIARIGDKVTETTYTM